MELVLTMKLPSHAVEHINLFKRVRERGHFLDVIESKAANLKRQGGDASQGISARRDLLAHCVNLKNCAVLEAGMTT